MIKMIGRILHKYRLKRAYDFYARQIRENVDKNQKMIDRRRAERASR